jgi:hypothetical protein
VSRVLVVSVAVVWGAAVVEVVAVEPSSPHPNAATERVAAIRAATAGTGLLRFCIGAILGGPP